MTTQSRWEKPPQLLSLFREKALRTFTSMKDFDYKTLTDEELAYTFAGKSFKIPMLHHQLVSMAFAADRDRVMFPHDVGTCKTLTALLTAEQWGCKRILVVCPQSAFSAWEGDTTKYTNFSLALLMGARKDREKKVANERNVSVINYEGLKSLYARLYQNVDGDGNGQWIMHEAKVDAVFDCIIFDEIHRTSNYKSLQSQICLELAKKTRYVIGLSGTPVDKSMLELFNIYMLVDLGRSLGTNFFAYRTTYFDPPKWGYEWKLKPGAQEKILERLTNCTIRYSRQECFDLPEIQEIELLLPPSEEFLSLQKCVIDGDPLWVGDNQVETVKPEAKAAILRELASGFFYHGEDRQMYGLKENPKLDALIDIIQDNKAKLIVFHQFIAGACIIEEALDKAKIKFAAVRGGQSQVDRKKYIDAFTKNPNITVMLAHPVCASEGFDGSVADTVIFFDAIASPKIRKQCIGRIHRKGQTKKTLVIDLMLDKSLDKTIAKNRSTRISMVEMVMQFIKDYHSGK